MSGMLAAPTASTVNTSWSHKPPKGSWFVNSSVLVKEGPASWKDSKSNLKLQMSKNLKKNVFVAYRSTD
jgi:hypothetical protein